MFDGIIQDAIPAEMSGNKVDTGKLPNFNTDPLPSIPEGNGIGADLDIAGRMQREFDTPSREAALAPTPFDWDKEQMSKFQNAQGYNSYGADPEAGPDFNEEKFAHLQTAGDRIARGVEGFGSGLVDGFGGMVGNLKNIGSWFSDPTLQSSFKEDQLEEILKKQQQSDDQYHIFGENPGVLGSMMKGLQSSGNFIGSLAEVAASTFAIQAIVAGSGGAASPLEGIEAAELSEFSAAEIAANTEKITDAINKGVNPNTWSRLSQFAADASTKLPLPWTNGAAFIAGDLLQGAKGGALATTVRGFGAFANDINTINTATGFASGNAASTYQQQLNDQVENYKKNHDGESPDLSTLQDFKDKAIKSAKVDGALNAYAMLFLEKAAFGNLLNSKATTEALLERNSFKDIGVKPWWVKGAEEEPLYIKQQYRWFDFKNNLLGNYGEGVRGLATKGVEFGAFGNVMPSIDKSVKSYYDAKYNNEDVSVLDAVRNGVDSQFSKEGAQTFISGFLQGAITLGIFGAALGRVKDWGIEKSGTLKDKLTMSPEDYKNKQGKTAARTAAHDSGRVDFVNKTNRSFGSWDDPLNPVKDIFHGMIMQNMFDNTGKDSLASGSNVKDFHDVKDDASREFLLRMSKSGLDDLWVQRMQKYAQSYSQDDLCKMLNIPSTPENYQRIKETVAELPGRLKELKRISKSVEDTLGSPFNPDAKDPVTGKRLYKFGSEEYNIQANNKRIHDQAKDMLITMHDEAERKIVRQGEILNGKGDSEGILKMPFAETSNFSTIYSAMSPEYLERDLYLADQELAATEKGQGKGALSEKRNAIDTYKQSLENYIKGLKDIHNKGAYPEREADLQKHRDKYREELTKNLHNYLDKSLLQVNLDGKVTQVRKPPTLQEVREGIDKMMDYYDLGVEHERLLDNLNLLLDPSIIKKYQMAFFTEANRRQEEAFEKDNKEVTDLKKERAKHLSLIEKLNTPGEGQMSNKDELIKKAQDRIDEIDALLTKMGKFEPYTKSGSNPPPPPEETGNDSNTDTDLAAIKTDIRNWMTNIGDVVEAEVSGERPAPVKLSVDAKLYLDDNPDLNKAVKSLMSQLSGIYRDGKDKDAETLIDGLLNKHFDSAIDILSFDKLKGSPKVEEVSPGVYTITGDTSKKYTSVIDANKALRERYPEFKIGERKFQVGQVLYNDEVREYTLEGRNSVKDDRGNVKTMTDEELIEYHNIKPAPPEGKPEVPVNRIPSSMIGEIAEIRPAGLNGNTTAHKHEVEEAFRNIPREDLYDNLTLSIVRGLNVGASYQNDMITDNPYVKFRNDDYTVTLHIAGLDRPMYIQSPYKNVYDFGNGPTFELPKDKFELVYKLEGKSLDDAYNQYQEAFTKMQQLAKIIDQVTKLGDSLTGTKLEKVLKIDIGKGSLDWAPVEERPTLEDVEATGKEVVAVVDRTEEKTLYGKFDKDVNPIPDALDGSKHLALIELKNGDRAWVEMHTPSFGVTTPEDFDRFVTDNINGVSKSVQEAKANPEEQEKILKIANDNLKSLFITQNPNLPVVVSFPHIRMMKDGYINVALKVERNITMTDSSVQHRQVLDTDGKNPFHVIINAKAGTPLNFGRIENGLVIPDGSKFIQRLEKEINDYFGKPAQQKLIGALTEPIKIGMENVRKGYNVGESGKLDRDTVMQSTINTTTDIVHNQKIDYSFPETGLPEEVVPLGADQKPTELTNDNDLDSILSDLNNVDKKVIVNGVEFDESDIVDINTFKEDVATNLPAFISVVDTLATNLTNSHTTVGQFVMKANRLTGFIRGEIRTTPGAPYKYHEAFHSMFRMLLSVEEQRTLLNEANLKNPITSKKLEAFRKAGYTHDDPQEEKDRLQEEWMADKFDGWKKDHNTIKSGGIKSWFEKLWNFIKELYNRFSGNRLEAMFYKYNRQGFKYMKLQDNEFTTTPNSVNKLIDIAEGKTLDQNTGVQLTNTIAAIYAMEKPTTNLSREQLIESILDNYKTTLDPRQSRYTDIVKALHQKSPENARNFVNRLKEVYSVFSNDSGRKALTDAVEQKLKLKNYTEDEEVDKDRSEFEKGKGSWEDSADMKGGYGTLLPSIREYIEQTVVPGTDEFGNTEMANGKPVYVAVDGQKVYNTLSQLLRNTPDRNIMINKMIAARNNGDAGAVIRRLFADVQFSRSQGIWNVQKNPLLFQQFINGLRQASVDHITGELIGGNAKAYSANRQDSAQKQVDTWAGSFNEIYLSGYQNTSAKKTYQKEHLKPLITLRDLLSDTEHDFINDNDFITKSQSLSNNLKEQLGISLDPVYIHYSIAHNKLNKSEYMSELMSTYKATPIDVADISGIHTVLLKGDNPFSEDITGATTRLKDIAAGNAVFDQDVDSGNYVDAEGKTRHSMQKYNYLLEQAAKLNTDQEIERLSQDLDTSGSHLLSDNKWLNWDKKLAIVDGLTTGEGEGTVSKSWNTRETNAYPFTLYGTPHEKGGVYGTWVVPIVVSDKSTMWMTSAPVIPSVYKDKAGKLRITDNAMNKLISIVKDDVARIDRVKEEIDTLPEDEKVQGRHIADSKGGVKGLKFDRASAMLGDLGRSYEEDFDKDKLKDYTVKQQIEKYFLGKDGTIAKYIDEELAGSGLVTKSGGKYTNALLPDYLWTGLTNVKQNDALNLSNDFLHNVSQVYISNYLNAEGFMHLLFPYGINVKRMSVANSAGDSAKTLFAAPELGINRPFTHFHIATIKEPKGENNFDLADSQMYCTEEGMRYTRFGFGRLTQVQAGMMDKIASGRPLTRDNVFGEKGLIKNGDAFNPLKPAFFDGKTSVKCSVVMLSKDMLMVKDSTGKYIPDIRYKDTLYPIWKSMRDFETANNTVAFVTPESSFKTVIKNSADTPSDLSADHFHEFDADYLRDQVYLPSNKIEMTKPTQPVWNLPAEQDDNTKVYNTTVGEIKKQYGEAVSNRLTANWNNALNAMFELTDGQPLTINSSIDHNTINVKLADFYNQMRENLQATGANEQTLGFLEVRDGEPVFPALDFPSTLEKYTNMVMKYFGKVMNESVPGISATKVSPYGMNVIRQIHEVDNKGVPVPGKWSVIDDNMYREDSEKYQQAKTYTNPDTRSFSGLKAGDYIIDHLKANVPEFDASGEHTGIRYNEYKFPIHHLEDDGSQDSPIAIGYRNDIPYADKNSGSVFKRVDTLPIHLGSVQVNPSDQSRAGGKDHDADKDFLQIADTYTNKGELIPYGTATTDKGMFNEFVMWNRKNNPIVRKYERDAMNEDEEVQQIKKDLNNLKISNEHIVGKLVGMTKLPEGIVNLRSARSELMRTHKTQATTVEALETQLQEINGIYILQALDNAKLPYRTDDFMSRGGSNLNVGVQNNKELRAKIALAGNDNVTGGDNPINLRPTSTSLLSDLVKPDDGNSFHALLTRYKAEHTDLDETALKNIDELLTMFQDSGANLNEMRGISIAQRSVSAGKNSVGVAANGVPTLSFFMLHKVPITGDHIRFNGVDYDYLGGSNATNGIRKFEVLMSYINTMTDNAKLELASKLGLSIDALSDAMTMTASGMNVDDVQLYLLQPAVREYYKAIAHIKGSLKTPEEDRMNKSSILKDMIEGYDSCKPQELTKADLEKGLVGEPKEEGALEEYLHNQLSALVDIQKAQRIGSQIFQTSRVTALAGGLRPTWEGYDNFNIAYEELGIKDGKAVADHEGAIDVANALLSDPITSTYIKMFTQVGKVGPELFLERSPIFRRLMNIQLAQFRSLGGAEVPVVIKQVKQDLISHLSILALLRKPGWGDMDNGMIYTTLQSDRITDVYNRLRAMKGKNKNYFINDFIRPVFAGQLDNKSKIDKLLSNNWAKLSDSVQLKIRDSFMEGYNNPKTHDDFEKIFKYLLVKDGGQFRNGSFIKFIAPALFKDLYDSTADVKKALAVGNYTDDTAMRLFGTDWDSVMNDYVKWYGLHPDNKKYLKSIKTPVLDTSSQTHDNLKSLGFTVYGDEGKEVIELPQTYRSGNNVYKLIKIYKRDRGEYTGNLVERGDTITTGYRGVYEATDTRGAIGTYRAGGTTFGSVPSTSKLLGSYTIPEKVPQLPYSPESKVPVTETTTKVQGTEVPETPVTKQLFDKHGVLIQNVGGKSVAYQNGNEMQLPTDVKTPKDFLGYLERQIVQGDEQGADYSGYDDSEGYDEDAIAEMAQRAALKRQNIVPSQSMQQPDLFAPKPQPTIGIQKPLPGVELVNSGINITTANSFIDLLQPQIQKQAYKENKGRNANKMFSFGLNWGRRVDDRFPARHSENNKYAVKNNSFMGEKDMYRYFTKDQYGNPITDIKSLQPIIDYIQSKIGIDMSAYDTVLGNIYEPSTFISQHRDTTESKSAENYPVIVLNLGASGPIILQENTGKETKLTLENGGIYAFGINGENRLISHRTVDELGQNTLKPLKIGNDSIGRYRITLTFRRAQDLGNELKTPSRQQPVVPSQQKNVSMNATPLSANFTRQSVMNDPTHLYLFTDNAKRSSGSNKMSPDTTYSKRYGQGSYPTMTQAVIRGLENAYPITTMVDDKRTQWTDNKFDEYKKIIDSEVDHIKQAMSSGQYVGMKFAAQMPFGKGQISDMKASAPKIWQYMTNKLKALGIDNTGDKPKTYIGELPVDWKSEIDKLAVGKPKEWIETARGVYTRGKRAGLDDKTILESIKNC